MTWIKFHGGIRQGKHRGIPRALRFVLLELAHESRPGRGVLELPVGMALLDGVHDLLGGDRREVGRALDIYTAGPDPGSPTLVIEGEPGALRLRIPSWETWNTVDSSADRTAKYRENKRTAEPVTRHSPSRASQAGDGVTIARGEERRSEERRSERDPDPDARAESPIGELSTLAQQLADEGVPIGRSVVDAIAAGRTVTAKQREALRRIAAERANPGPGPRKTMTGHQLPAAPGKRAWEMPEIHR